MRMLALYNLCFGIRTVVAYTGTEISARRNHLAENRHGTVTDAKTDTACSCTPCLTVSAAEAYRLFAEENTTSATTEGDPTTTESLEHPQHKASAIVRCLSK